MEILAARGRFLGSILNSYRELRNHKVAGRGLLLPVRKRFHGELCFCKPNFQSAANTCGAIRLLDRAVKRRRSRLRGLKTSD